MEKYRHFQSQKINAGSIFYYRAGLCTYAERLQAGMFRSFGFNGAGYNPAENQITDNNGTITDVEEYVTFIVEVDGQSLISHWEYLSEEQSEENGILNVKIHLRHKHRPVEVALCTKMDGSGCFSRWLEIKNCDEKPVPLGRCAPFSGMLEVTRSWRKLIQDKASSPYRLGYFENTEWGHEGQFKWHELHTDCYSFGGRYTRDRFRHPFFVLENKAKGPCFAAQIAYSGGYKFSFDFRPDPVDGNLAVVMELDGTKPLRVIAPGETVTTPEIIISMVNGDMDMAIQQMHEHIRTAVMMPPHGEGCYLETCGDAKTCAERGFDIVYIDAGWYYPAGQKWNEWTGIWDPDPARFPNGLKHLSEDARKHGIRFGLWQEPERLGQKAGESGLHEKHFGWFCIPFDDFFYAGPNSKGAMYNLGLEEAEKYIESQICKIIDENDIDFYRLDYNCGPIPCYSYNMRDGYLENNAMRYYESFRRIFNNVRNKYPHIIFENCASGGGRTDLGCVKYFDHTWVTDNPIAPRCFSITNGMTMCLPPELVDRLVTTMEAPRMADLDFQLFLLMFVRPTSHFPRENPENPLQINKFRKFMKLYNEFARPMLPKCKIFHHTPSFEDCEPKGLGILESVSENADKAMLGVFALSDPKVTETVVRFKGVDASKHYKVTAVSANESFEVSGYELKYKGITAFIKGALTAELFLAEEIK